MIIYTVYNINQDGKKRENSWNKTLEFLYTKNTRQSKERVKTKWDKNENRQACILVCTYNVRQQPKMRDGNNNSRAGKDFETIGCIYCVYSIICVVGAIGIIWCEWKTKIKTTQRVRESICTFLVASNRSKYNNRYIV